MGLAFLLGLIAARHWRGFRAAIDPKLSLGPRELGGIPNPSGPKT